MAANQPSIRAQRVADLVKREIAASLSKDIEDPRLKSLSLTAVDVSPDLRNAKIFFTLLDTDNVVEVIKVLNKASGFLRHSIASRCDLRYVPKLDFRYDNNLVEAENLVTLISNANVDMTGIEQGDSSETTHE